MLVQSFATGSTKKRSGWMEKAAQLLVAISWKDARLLENMKTKWLDNTLMSKLHARFGSDWRWAKEYN